MTVRLKETWIDDEELAYSSCAGGISGSRRKGLVRFPDGKLRKVTLAVPDTFFSIPARASRSFGGHRHGWVGVKDDEFVFHPLKGKED